MCTTTDLVSVERKFTKGFYDYTMKIKDLILYGKRSSGSKDYDCFKSV